MPDAEARLLELLDAERRYNQLAYMFPDRGPYRRELYPKHMAFITAGATTRERCFMGGNGVGKTVLGADETACHATGRYPDWWKGYRFDRPIEAWAAGKTNETTRDIIQKETLFGPIKWNGRIKGLAGTGLIPREDIGQITWKRGIPDLIDSVQIKSRFGGWSELGLKSYEQGRGSFEGTAKDVFWGDEEPPLAIYTEASMRLMTKRGLTILTFTPLEGMSEVVQAFLPGGRLPGEVDF